MIRRLLGGRITHLLETASALLFELVLAAATFVTFPLIVRSLGSAEYGEYNLIYTFTGLAGAWVLSSGGVALVQLLVQRKTNLDQSVHVAHRQVLMFAPPFGGVLFAVTVWKLGAGVIPAALIIFATELVITGWSEINLNALYAHRGQTPVTNIRMAAPIAKVIGVLALFAVGEINLLSLAIINMIAATVAMLLSVRAVSRMHRYEGMLDLDSQTMMSPKELRHYSFMHATTMTAYTLQNDGDNIALGLFRSKEELGEYAAAYRLVSTAMLPLRAVMTVSYRYFLQHDDNKNGQHLRRAKKLMVPTGAYGLLCGIGVFVFLPVTKWLLGPEFKEAAEITLWLCAFPIMRAAVDVPLLGILGLGRNRVRMTIGLLGATVAVTAYVLLVPPFGWRGGVIGTYISEIVVATVGWIPLAVLERKHDQARRNNAEADVEVTAQGLTP